MFEASIFFFVCAWLYFGGQTAVTIMRYGSHPSKDGMDVGSAMRAWVGGLFWPVVWLWIGGAGLVTWFTVPGAEKARWSSNQPKRQS